MRTSRLLVRLISGLLPIAALACALTLPAGAEQTVTDAGGRTVSVPDTSKILSIGGDITEILYELGLQARIIAVDSTSQFPAEALKEKANVGYMRALSTEGVLSIGASLIIASERSGPPEVVKALKQATVPYVEVQDGLSAEGVVEKVRFIASVVDAEAAGEKLAGEVEKRFAELASKRKSIERPVRALFVLNVQSGRATVGGAHTSADAILKLAGAENAAASVTGFKPLVDEALVELQPDAIVIMRRTGNNHDTDQLLSLKGIQATPAGAAHRVVNMDGLYLLGFGPRAPAAALDLMHKFYPDTASSGTSR